MTGLWLAEAIGSPRTIETEKDPLGGPEQPYPTTAATMQAMLSKRDGDGLSLQKDIILEVLVRLPAKDLCRFRCVSKGWHKLISDPAFVTAQKSRAGPVFVAMFESTQGRSFATGSTTGRHELRLLDMAGNVQRVFDCDRRASQLPTRLDLIFVDMLMHLHDFRFMDEYDDPASWYEDFTVVFGRDSHAFSDGRMVSCDYCFGRASPSGDYKVLRLFLASSRSHGWGQWCDVATITDGTGAEPLWRPRPMGPLSQTKFSCNEKPSISGVLYFMPDNIDFTSEDRMDIAAFDLESEEWKPEMIKGPLLGLMEEEHEEWFLALAQLKGTLCLVNNLCMFGRYADIWLLTDPDRSIWVKEYTLELPERILVTRPLDVLGDCNTPGVKQLKLAMSSYALQSIMKNSP